MRLNVPTVMLYLRVTARISAIFLAGAFAASALRLLWPSTVTGWLAAKRHSVTLLFVLSHTFHLAGVVALATLIPDKFFSWPALLGVIAGGLGYAVIYYLAGTAFVRRKNPELRDSKMQTASLYILWAIFTLAFVGGIRSYAWIYVPLASMMLVALVARIGARWVSPAGTRASVAA